MQNIIVLTGAGKGIGRAIALEFASKARSSQSFNPVLVLCSRTIADIEKIANECKALGTETIAIEADIANLDDIDRLVTSTLEQFGTIDCLINNAGVGRFKSLTELSEEDFDYTMSVNMKGTFFLTQKYFLLWKASVQVIFFSSPPLQPKLPSKAPRSTPCQNSDRKDLLKPSGYTAGNAMLK